jgi:hypothetical protein
MIENMLSVANSHMPLKIEETLWNGATFQMYGEGWSFATLSAWRLSTSENVICGCYDQHSEGAVKALVEQSILKIEMQESLLRIDPVFILSNDLRLEIFSTDTFEPWTFEVNGSGLYIATPGEPTAFENNN